MAFNDLLKKGKTMKIKRMLAVILSLSFLLTSCGSKTDKLSKKEDYLNILYGYYENDNTYISISKDYYEEKEIKTGKLLLHGETVGISVSLIDDGLAEYYIELNNGDKTYTITADNQLIDQNENVLKEISQKKYESVAAVKNEESDQDYLTPWYYKEYDMYRLEADLHQIEIKLAVGETDSAAKLLEKNVYDVLDKKVNEFISEREYCLAQNYVAMHQLYLKKSSDRFPFVTKYVEENTKDIGGLTGIDATARNYYKLIGESSARDNNMISKQECLYKLNAHLLKTSGATATGLYKKDNFFAYHWEILENHEPVYYYIINPYTQKIWEMPNSYFFVDGTVNNYEQEF